MIKRPRASQTTRHRSRRVSIFTLIAAFMVACVVAALAFGFPMEHSRLNAPDPAVDGLEQLSQPLQLPDATQSTLLDEDWQPQFADWTTVTVQKGDSLSAIFDRLGLPSEQLYQMLDAGSEARALETLQPDQVLRLRIEGDQLRELVYETDRISGTRIFRDGGAFKIAKYMHRIEQRPAFASGVIEDTFLDAARAAGLSTELGNRLRRIFAHRVDFSHQIKPQDSFTVLYEEHYFAGDKIADGDILAAELMLDEHRYRAIGFRDEHGKMHYYTPEGKGLEPAFMRYPAHFERVSSPFSANRLHPVLGIKRPHTGIDLAAPRGTPIRSVGDGVVVSAGWQSGYGRTVVIDHGRGYKTLYAHMAGFAKGLDAGDPVSRGQLIGYVGRSGLATGPHVHFEVQVNGRPRNPATIALPGDPPIPDKRVAEFRRYSEPLLAQIDLLRRTRLALQSN